MCKDVNERATSRFKMTRRAFIAFSDYKESGMKGSIDEDSNKLIDC